MLTFENLGIVEPVALNCTLDYLFYESTILKTSDFNLIG